MSKRRPLALGAAAAIGLGSLFIASPAIAEDNEALDLTAQAFQDGAQIEQETGLEGLHIGAATTTSGESVVLVSETIAEEDKDAVVEEAEKVNSKVAIINDAVAHAQDEVVGGAGYFGFVDETTGEGGTCSTGFTGFAPNGDPALITAGHCSGDGAISDVVLTTPSDDAAGGDLGLLAELGAFGFSQYGGPGNSVGAEDDPSSTDIAVIDVDNADLTLLPEVADWSADAVANDDLASSTTLIRSVGLPESGTVEKSGRTTGYTSGSTIVDLPYTDGNVYPTEILDGYMQIGDPNDPENPRWVHGFIGGALTDPGDSGGAVYQGDKAVGVVSGGPSEPPAEGDDWAWYALLQPALEQIPDAYEVAVHINAPELTSHADGDVVEAGETISGTVGANATAVSIGDGNSGSTEDIEGGEWSFTAPEEPGDYTYSVQGQRGHSTSATLEFNFTVEEAPLEAPAIDDVSVETDEAPITATVTGTGIAGAELTLAGDLEGTTTVDENGEWSVEVEGVDYGVHEVTASQVVDGETSASAQGTVTVAPTAPADLSIEADTSFPNDEAPSEISGTGIPGATVSVTVNGEELTAEVDENGDWTIDFGAPLEAGSYALSFVQTINGATSSATAVSFTVQPEDSGSEGGSNNEGDNTAAAEGDDDSQGDNTAAAEGDDSSEGDNTAAAEGTADADGSDAGAEGTAGAGGSGEADGDEELSNTGGLDLAPYMLAAAGMLALGIGAVVLTQRRLNRDEVES